ncbi:Phosphatidylserine decarboxylase proenzyme, mitochondrial [Hondaea fermentalgiana]|uniref:phosphatidylserine decarboxylase n=1 Tax=Hondaea fermentalgiana TaxID=2315210 RepID=A0A2R5GQL2_9STRA|nr:Phosphatidylserine decarboxylase proenzyme, mitochondrial [Hondaea fermentalgiana]|eukprot:GBG32895.1 Phosphatidylserine decarboxylase proenzyme, mitochondrial [Hondaea fermentalgiana]
MPLMSMSEAETLGSAVSALTSQASILQHADAEAAGMVNKADIDLPKADGMLLLLVLFLFLTGAGLSYSLEVGLRGAKMAAGVANRKRLRVRVLAYEWWLAFLVHAIPYRWLSQIWGRLTQMSLPPGIKQMVYMGWAKTFNCNLDEMARPLEEYASLREFFLRPLKPGLRPVDETPNSLVCPVDGKVLHVGAVSLDRVGDLVLEQVKGIRYHIENFIGPVPAGFDNKLWDDSMERALADFDAMSMASDISTVEAIAHGGKILRTIVIYLGPGDYHHFHSPTEWKILQRRHYPGNLLPVKPWAARHIPELYCTNERVVLNGQWKHGFLSFTAVGALNVGSIDIACEPELATNQSSRWPFQCPRKTCSERNYEPAHEHERGERMGAFNLGSTVVLIAETPANFDFCVKEGDVVRMGELLAKSL